MLGIVGSLWSTYWSRPWPVRFAMGRYPALDLVLHDCAKFSCSYPGPDRPYCSLKRLAGRFKKERIVPEVDRCRGVRNVAIDLHPEIELDHIAFAEYPPITGRCGIVRCILV